jgi:RimJ/RimL family protein N-acetyltransferase
LESNGGIEMIYQLSEEYYVRTLREADLAGSYPSWFEDQDVSRYNSHGKFFKTEDDFRNFMKTSNSENRVVWAICHKKDGHIGNVSLDKISFINRNADYVVIIGNKIHWKKGIAFMASQAIIRHGFNKLNLKRIWCATASSNLPMQALAKKLGMIQEGCRRSHFYFDGKWDDMVEFGMLKNECSFL